MKLNSLLWSLLLKLPELVKTPILRRLVHFPEEIPSTLRFKVAETQEELTQAFTLLHDAYVREKLMDPHPSGMRVTKYHALPCTSTLIAIENGQVVGTVSLIRHGAFGIPLQSIFDLDHLPPDARVAEVSALAIKKEFQHQRGRILFPLLKFLFHYSHDYFGVSHFVIAVNPKWIDFYKSILLFKPLSKKMVENYSFVNGAPAVGGILDISRSSVNYFKTFYSKRKKMDLFKFFHEVETKNMEFPLRKKSVISDPIMSPDLFEHFFIRSTSCLSTMTESEVATLREMYDHPDYLRLLPKTNVVFFHKKRDGHRYQTRIQGRLQFSEGESTPLHIQNISKGGLGGVMKPQGINLNASHKILVNIDEVEPCELIGHFTRISSNGEFGFRFTQSCERWSKFIRSLDRRLILVSETAGQQSTLTLNSEAAKINRASSS